MSQKWDIFVDEKKAADGEASGIGLLVVEAGVVGQMSQHLLSRKNQLEGSSTRIGSVHWSDLKDLEAKLACEWLDKFFHAPLVFYVYVPVGEDAGSQPRVELVKGAVGRLEVDSQVPAGGIQRGRTALHLDYEGRDARWLHQRLVRDFGLDRAYHWSDRDSPLLQLSDLLLGISERDHSGSGFGESARETHKRRVFDHAREKASSSIPWVLCYEPTGGMRRLLVS